jgi:hypothetical protein
MQNCIRKPYLSSIHQAVLGISIFLVLTVVTSTAVYAQSEELVMWNKLGSEQEVLNSEVGGNGELVGVSAEFEPAKFGNGVIRKQAGEDIVKFPSTILDGLRRRGTMELWITPKVSSPVPFEYGFWALVGQANTVHPWKRGNVYLMWGDGVTGQGIFGGVAFDEQFAETPHEIVQYEAKIGVPFHVAISWDIDGISGSADRVRVYRNGNLIGFTASLWNPDGTTVQDNFNIGSSAGGDPNSGDKWITDNIRVWNQAKTDFTDRYIEGHTSAGGQASGFDAKRVICHNQTTGQSVRIRLEEDLGIDQQSWDCDAAGLIVNPGDDIGMRIGGSGL